MRGFGDYAGSVESVVTFNRDTSIIRRHVNPDRSVVAARALNLTLFTSDDGSESLPATPRQPPPLKSFNWNPVASNYCHQRRSNSSFWCRRASLSQERTVLFQQEVGLWNVDVSRESYFDPVERLCRELLLRSTSMRNRIYTRNILYSCVINNYKLTYQTGIFAIQFSRTRAFHAKLLGAYSIVYS